MATTNFSPLVGDAEGRYGAIDQTTLEFGIPSTRNDSGGNFAIPVIKFKFYDAKGADPVGAPTIYMQAPAQFDLQQLAQYQATGPIFGSGTSYKDATQGEDSFSLGGRVVSGAKSFGEALMSSVARSFTNFQGYIESAGQSGIDQAEFTNRRMVNPLQQLLYKGPQFKPYSFNFNLRPRSQYEAKSAMDIISAFKIANSPQFEEDPSSIFTAQGLLTLVEGQPLTFGYPDLVEFELMMYKGNGTETDASSLYKSKLCAIESIGANYGQQKLTFFDPGIGGNVYYPTEIVMSLSLKEVVLRTTEDAIIEAQNGTTIR